MSKLILVGLILFGAWLLIRKPRAPRKAARRPTYAEAEARSLLGVSATADDDAIRAAHRRLIGTVHPDRGGSQDMTSRINAARDLLLKR